MTAKTRRRVLDTMNAAFIQSGVSIVASSRDAKNVPVLARAIGCRVSADRSRVTILLPQASAADLLETVRSGAPVAVVFSQPSTHRTIQLKGSNAVRSPADPKDRALWQRYVQAFVADVCPLGYKEEPMTALVSCDPKDLVAVTFTPETAFLQTPGPRAGTPLTS